MLRKPQLFRSIPKVKALNQCGVIFPKPLLSCWKRNEDCTGRKRGQLCREGSLCRWDRSRVTPGLATAPGPTLAKDKVSWFPAGDAPYLLLGESAALGTSAHSWSDVRACSRAVLGRGCSPGEGWELGWHRWSPLAAWLSCSCRQQLSLCVPECHRLGTEDQPVPPNTPDPVRTILVCLCATVWHHF